MERARLRALFFSEQAVARGRLRGLTSFSTRGRAAETSEDHAMWNLIKPLTAVALFACAGAAFAQTAEDDAAAVEETTEATEVDAAEADGLSMGAPESQVSEPFVKGTFGDWELRCVRAQGNDEICQLYQLLRDREGNSVAEFNMFPLPEGQQAVAGANIVTPLETLLTANLRLAVDGGQAKVYPYSFCSQVGCFSRIGLTAAEVDTFRKGATANVTIVPAAAPTETVELSLSLTGFTAGFNALLESEKARTGSQ